MITPVQKDDALLSDIETAPEDESLLHIWWLGQSGFLLKHGDHRVLLDPYLSDSLTKKYAATDKPHVRMTERCIAPERLTKVNLITSSHMHTDHFDVETLKPLFEVNPGAVFLMTTANLDEAAKRLGDKLPRGTNGMRDGDIFYSPGIVVCGVIAAHNEVDRDEAGNTRYMGFLIEIGPFRVYHSGDTLWHDDIVKSLRELPCDVAFLPINGNKPERRVAGNLNGTEAAAMAKAGDVRLAVPHHFEMFEFNTASPDEFVGACERIGQTHRVMRCGERLTVVAQAF
jgi:L-ascorbate metabolism protein UlaG (beta-lactamase superfamily)